MAVSSTYLLSPGKANKKSEDCEIPATLINTRPPPTHYFCHLNFNLILISIPHLPSNVGKAVRLASRIKRTLYLRRLSLKISMDTFSATLSSFPMTSTPDQDAPEPTHSPLSGSLAPFDGEMGTTPINEITSGPQQAVSCVVV